MASACMPSTNEQANDLILVDITQLKPMIKAQISGKMVSSGISDIVIASMHLEKTHLKKCIMGMIILIGRAKRAPHWVIQSKFCVIYVSMSVMS